MSKVNEVIRKVDGKYVVYPEGGGDRLGTHDTREEAEAQIAAIEASKRRKNIKEAVWRHLRN